MQFLTSKLKESGSKKIRRRNPFKLQHMIDDIEAVAVKKELTVGSYNNT